MKRLFFSLILSPAMLLAAATPAVKASEPILLSSVIDQQSTDSTTTDSTIPTTGSSHSHQFLIGPEASIFFPTSGKTEQYYGKSWSSIGFGLGSAYQASLKGNISPFLTILYNSHDSNYAFLLPFGVGYEKALSGSADSAYYGADLLGLAADQRAVEYGIHSGFRYGAGARVLFGYEFGKYAYLQASYMETTEVKNIDFSGTTLEAGFRF